MGRGHTDIARGADSDPSGRPRGTVRQRRLCLRQPGRVRCPVHGAKRNRQRRQRRRLDHNAHRARSVETQALVEDAGRPTIVKERLLGSVQSTGRAIQQLLRVDNEHSRPLSTPTEAEVLARLQRELERTDGVLICDINKGLLTPAVLKAIIEGARRQGKPLIVDPRMADDFSLYRGASALTPNRYETERATGLRLSDPEAWQPAARKLIDDLGLNACLVTLDRDGMFLAGRDGAALHIETAPREVYDVTGAGDVVLAIFGLFLIAGADMELAAKLANVAAGMEVGKQGAAVVSRAELAQALQRVHHGSAGKILSRDELLPVLERRRRAGLRICLTNGCFDLLHAGHVESLEFARSQGDLLVVALNDDSSVCQIKGEGRPVYPAADRARILAALEAVDYVVIFDDPRAENITRAVRPDVLVMGEDWQGKTVDGAEFVQNSGGKVVRETRSQPDNRTSAPRQSLAGRVRHSTTDLKSKP